MLTEKELEKVLDVLQSRLDSVNTFFIRKVADQIKRIGELGQANINRLVIMADMTSNVAEITRMLEETTGLNTQDVQKIYAVAMREIYTDPRFTAAFSPTAPVSPTDTRQRMDQYARNLAAQTAQTLENLSNTTAVADPYRRAIDRGIFAVSSGLTSYQEATRQAVREIGYNGLQVQYESGYHRRLDTAVRQNIIDGTNQIAQHGAKMVGEVLQYDAVELTAHLHSAPDHEPVQGRIFLISEYEKMQAGYDFVDINGRAYAGFKRPIAEWNCMHFALPFSTKHSTPRYTQEQLDDWAIKNNAGCEIDGKHRSTYEASQIMRKIETEVRRMKDVAVAAQIVGDNMLRRQCQLKINALGAKYDQVVKVSGLPSRRQRMTVEGFRAVKIKS